MIKSLTLKNFRNFSSKKFLFNDIKNIIIGENGKGKTNILEAISLFSGINFSKINFDNLVLLGENYFYIEIVFFNGNKFSISYDKEKKQKKYQINSKNTTKNNFIKNSYKVVLFSPIIMNIMYLSPNLRRDFLDEILINTFEEYKKLLSDYKKILTSRNKLLKNIREKKSHISELNFWNEKFSNIATIIYNYRFGIVNYIENNIKDFTKYFDNKIKKIEFKYKSKIEIKKKNTKNENIIYIKEQINKYLKENLQKDIILGNTNIGSHTDDFEILVDNINLIEFASRGEVKSTIIGLKLLEINFIEKLSNKKPILLIDDLLSELDSKHKELLLKSINKYQTFITSIRKEYEEDNNIIRLN